jgi:DUF177 domain-containing protein
MRGSRADRAGVCPRRQPVVMAAVSSSSPASHAKPPAIDPTRFARDGARFTGALSPAQLPRIAQELFDDSGAVGYQVEGFITPKGEPALRLELTIEIAVPCQRCMDRLPIRLEVARTLILSRDVEELESVAEEEDDVDSIPLVATLDLLGLIDEEVMLSLPLAPRHADDECQARGASEQGATGASPFSVLSRLKRT